MERPRSKRVTGDDALRIAALFTMMVLVLVTRAARDPRWGDFTDFEVMRAAGKAVVSGHGADVYRNVRAFFHPPFFALLCAPLGFLSPHGAYFAVVAFELAVWCAAILAWSRLVDAPRGRLVTAWLVASCAPALWVSLEYGQPAAIFLASIGFAGVFLRRGRDLAAGLVLSMLFVKPQYAGLALLALGAMRAWRTIGAAVAGGAMLFVAGLALGPSTTIAWIEATQRLSALMAQDDWSHQYQQWSLLSALRTTGLPRAGALGVYAVLAIALTRQTLRAIDRLHAQVRDASMRDAVWGRTCALVALYVAVVTPYLFSYDDALLAGPGVVFAVSNDPRPRWMRVSIAVCIASTFALGYSARWIRPFAPMGFVTAAWLSLEAASVRDRSV